MVASGAVLRCPPHGLHGPVKGSRKCQKDTSDGPGGLSSPLWGSERLPVATRELQLRPGVQVQPFHPGFETHGVLNLWVLHPWIWRWDLKRKRKLHQSNR